MIGVQFIGWNSLPLDVPLLVNSIESWASTGCLEWVLDKSDKKMENIIIIQVCDFWYWILVPKIIYLIKLAVYCSVNVFMLFE